jgi:hypothetical protein
MATTSATPPTSQDRIRRDNPGGLEREAVMTFHANSGTCLPTCSHYISKLRIFTGT